MNKRNIIRNSIRVFALILFCFNSSIVYATESTTENVSSNETIVSYAMLWNENPNINYVHGGPGRGKSLEDCDKDKLGTDCSGFVSSVYMHFGMNILGTSEDIKARAISTTTKEEEAMPGDVIWWSGHVAIYIGEGKLIHTNTSKPDKNNPQMPTNYIHVSEIKDCRVGSTPTFCRMTDDTSILGQGTSSKQVEDAKSVGSVLTESDLTGMPIPSTLEAHAEMIRLYGADDLSLVDGNSLGVIKENMKTDDKSLEDYFGVLCSILGLLLVVYAIFLVVAIIFDRLNNWFDMSLVELLSFNRWSLVNNYDIEDGLVSIGYNKENNKTYLTCKLLIFRVVIMFIVGILLIYQAPLKILSKILLKFIH